MTKRVRFYSIDFPGHRGVIKECWDPLYQLPYQFLYTVPKLRGKHTITQHNEWDDEKGPLDAGNFIYWRGGKLSRSVISRSSPKGHSGSTPDE